MLLQEEAQLLLDLLWGEPLRRGLALTALALVRLLLKPFGVPQRVERVVGRAHTGTNARQHNDLDLVVREERVTQDHGQLRLPERHVLALAALRLGLVERADALLEAEQRLVDLGALDPTLLVVALAVLGAL